MQFPSEVSTIVRNAVEANPDDVAQAIADATDGIRRLDSYDDICRSLVAAAIQGLVYDARHRSTVATKREARQYGQPQKAGSAASSTAVKHVYRSFFDTFFIGGMAIGSMTLEVMTQIENDERKIANGHTINADLLGWLRTRVKPGKTVRESVRETELRERYNTIYQKVNGK